VGVATHLTHPQQMRPPTVGVARWDAMAYEVEAEDGKEGVVSRVTVVPLEKLENVLAMTASVRKRPWTETLYAGTERSSPLVPRGRRRSGLVHHVRHLERPKTPHPAPDESRSHTERTLEPAVPNRSVEVTRTG
jgi:hypothetical protein